MKLCGLNSLFKSKKDKKQLDKLSQDKINKKAEHFPFDFDRWFKSLKDFTFNSYILPINQKIARAMVNYYQQRFIGRNVLTSKDASNLIKLQTEIQEFMDQIHCKDGIFVRMSNRSPKDGTPLLENNQTMASIYKKIIRKNKRADSNKKLQLIFEEQLKILKCQSSDQVMNLLLTSERVYQDLLLALDANKLDPNDNWSTSVILREWQADLREDFEFRVFVANNKVTAISQYNPYCQYDSLCSLNKRGLSNLTKRILDFVEKVDPNVGHKDYIIDVAIKEDGIYIIELNPFAPSTSACLYSWESDHDLLCGITDEKPSIKIRREMIPDPEEFINKIISLEEQNSKDTSEHFDVLLQSFLPSKRLTT